MAITTAFCVSAKPEMMTAVWDLTATTGDALKVALIKATPTGTYDANITNAGTPGTGTPSTSNLGTDEVSGTGYTSGGAALTNITPVINGTAGVGDFPDVTWASASFSADGCMIYNSTDGNRALSIHDFGGTKTASGGNFVLQFPAADSSNAIVRLA